MTHATDAKHLRPGDMRAQIPTPDGKRFYIGFCAGNCRLNSTSRKMKTCNNPTAAMNVYVVIRGAGKFQMGDEIVPFDAGDFLFVPAGMQHRFLDFGRKPRNMGDFLRTRRRRARGANAMITLEKLTASHQDAWAGYGRNIWLFMKPRATKRFLI